MAESAASVSTRTPLPPRLLCDGTLGALCRWLRAAGYDCGFLAPQKRARRDLPSQADAIGKTARLEGRIVLTRSPRIAEELGEMAVLIRDDHPYHQVLEVARRLELSLTRYALSRCREDNGLLVTTSADQVTGKVPPYVAATQKTFVTCPICGRVYWGATHRDSMLERLEELERLRLNPPPVDTPAE